MRHLSTFVIAAVSATAAFLAATAPAQAGETKEKFVHEGYTYVYEVTPTKDGKKISGVRYPGASAFNLNIKGDRVAGVSGGRQVTFPVSEAKGAAQ